MRINTILLAAFIGLNGFQLAEAKTKHPKPHHTSAHKVKKAKKYKHPKANH